MIHVVIGGSGSGKSAYAEDWLTIHSKAPRTYIATMKPFGRETLEKIERHREMRAGKGFISMDIYQDLSDSPVPVSNGILLECISNLVANELFREDKKYEDLEKAKCEIIQSVMKGIRHLNAQTEYLVIVTNNVHDDGIEYDRETMCYIELMGTINQQLAEQADFVTEIVYGIPVKQKGKEKN